ncbi:MAG: hypothetical protein PHW56_11265 [Methanosarcinaceae archaeon]|nr:hypothetical protein [Methanosarcinaceae archaeon]
MLGIDDPQIWLAYLSCIGSALLCVIYGALNWKERESEQTHSTGSPIAAAQE